MIRRVFTLYIARFVGMLGTIFGLRVVFIQNTLLRFIGVRCLGENFFQGRLTLICASNLRLKKRTAFGDQTRLAAYSSIEIGEDFLAAPGLNIDTGSHDLMSLEPRSISVKIGSRVWCGLNVIICGGVEIGDDVVIGAGSVVTRSLPTGVIAAGVPCRVIRPLERAANTRIWSAFSKRA
jgi:acetyltransferase-like isoleucine patch superfamily enzyme